jgi:hypothetical protein
VEGSLAFPRILAPLATVRDVSTLLDMTRAKSVPTSSVGEAASFPSQSCEHGLMSAGEYFSVVYLSRRSAAKADDRRIGNWQAERLPYNDR